MIALKKKLFHLVFILIIFVICVIFYHNNNTDFNIDVNNNVTSQNTISEIIIDNKSNNQSNAIKISNSEDIFKMHLTISSNAAIAEFQKLNIISDTLWEYQFKAKEWLYGDYRDEIIRVRVALNGWNGNYEVGGILKSDSFKVGHNYVLLLFRNDTIFLEYPRYEFVGNYVMDVNDLENSVCEKGTITITGDVTEENLKNYIKGTAQKLGYSASNVSKYYLTENKETVVKNCDAVFRVKPVYVFSRSRFEDMTVYACEVTECLKGTVTTNADGHVLMRVQTKADLKKNAEYIIPVSYRESGTFYDQASPICIFDAEDSEMETKIKEWLSEKNTAN